ncbi:MAG TPA: choice-of-anchor Q domain-containing protein [Prolixibacteraceae bacterium]|nr:choice-of-anchor Q domain-containing protein [Prolixibacteraceae bacterium]
MGTLEYEGAARVKMHNVKIQHMSYAGILAIKSIIEATNTLIANCGFYGAALLLGGDYDFNHCTVANYYRYASRQTPSVVISNILVNSDGKYQYVYENDLIRANWRNSIIWGDQVNELSTGFSESKQFNFLLDHCLVRLADTIDVSDEAHFRNIITKFETEDSLLFVDEREYKFMPDTLSPAIDAGLREYANPVPFDLNDVSRLNDLAPDLGAYERKEKTAEEE